MTGTAETEIRRTHAITTVELQRYKNNIALTTLQTLHLGALNVWGNSLPSETMPHEQITVDGVPFSVSPATGEAPDNIRCAGQYLELPETAADWLHLLATSERRCEETVHIHYSSGAADRERLRVSDFLPARSHFGELLAARSPAMHYPHHRQDNLSGQIWAVRVPVTRRETLRGFRLPDNPAIHIFALSTEEVR